MLRRASKTRRTAPIVVSTASTATTSIHHNHHPIGAASEVSYYKDRKETPSLPIPTPPSTRLSLLLIVCSIAITILILQFQTPDTEDHSLKRNKPTMYTYFQPLTYWSLTYEESKHSMIRAWEQSWRARGWSTRVLTESDAQQHKHYLFVKTLLVSLGMDSLAQQGYLRWLAMATTGGWLADYDTYPLQFFAKDGFQAMQASQGRFTAFSNHTPSLLYANASEWDRVLLELYRLLPDPNDDDFNVTDYTDYTGLYNLSQRADGGGIQWESQVWENLETVDECDKLHAKYAIHLSPRFISAHWRNLSFGRIIETEADALVHRGEAAAQLMQYYQRVCLSKMRLFA